MSATQSTLEALRRKWLSGSADPEEERNRALREKWGIGDTTTPSPAGTPAAEKSLAEKWGIGEFNTEVEFAGAPVPAQTWQLPAAQVPQAAPVQAPVQAPPFIPNQAAGSDPFAAWMPQAPPVQAPPVIDRPLGFPATQAGAALGQPNMVQEITRPPFAPTAAQAAKAVLGVSAPRTVMKESPAGFPTTQAGGSFGAAIMATAQAPAPTAPAAGARVPASLTQRMNEPLIPFIENATIRPPTTNERVFEYLKSVPSKVMETIITGASGVNKAFLVPQLLTAAGILDDPSDWDRLVQESTPDISPTTRQVADAGGQIGGTLAGLGFAGATGGAAAQTAATRLLPKTLQATKAGQALVRGARGLGTGATFGGARELAGKAADDMKPGTVGGVAREAIFFGLLDALMPAVGGTVGAGVRRALPAAVRDTTGASVLGAGIGGAVTGGSVSAIVDALFKPADDDERSTLMRALQTAAFIGLFGATQAALGARPGQAGAGAFQPPKDQIKGVMIGSRIFRGIPEAELAAARQAKGDISNLGYKEWRPGSGIWQLRDQTGKLVREIHEDVIVSGRQVPKVVAGRASRAGKQTARPAIETAPVPGAAPQGPAVAQPPAVAPEVRPVPPIAPVAAGAVVTPGAKVTTSTPATPAPVDRAAILREQNPGMEESAIQDIVRTTADVSDAEFPAFAQRVGKPAVKAAPSTQEGAGAPAVTAGTTPSPTTQATAPGASGVTGVTSADTATPKPLPPMQDNYLKPLSTYTDTLYHETNTEGAFPLIKEADVAADPGEPYFANTPDLALGQGANTGILLEFDAGDIQGQVNTEKPTWEMTYQQGQAEFIGKLNKQETYQSGLRAITVRADAKMDKTAKVRLTRTLADLENNGWTKTANADGSVTYRRPGSGVQPQTGSRPARTWSAEPSPPPVAFSGSRVQESVYHGSGADNIEQFFTGDGDLGGNTGASTARLGAFFSENPDIASSAAYGFSVLGAFDSKRKMTLYEANLNLKNPLDINNLSDDQIKALDARIPGFAKVAEKSKSAKGDPFNVVQFLSRFRARKPDVGNFSTFGKARGLSDLEVESQWRDEQAPIYREWMLAREDALKADTISPAPKILQDMGYDGIVVSTEMDTIDEELGPQKQYIVFKPKNVHISRKMPVVDFLLGSEGVAEAKARFAEIQKTALPPISAAETKTPMTMVELERQVRAKLKTDNAVNNFLKDPNGWRILQAKPTDPMGRFWVAKKAEAAGKPFPQAVADLIMAQDSLIGQAKTKANLDALSKNTKDLEQAIKTAITPGTPTNVERVLAGEEPVSLTGKALPATGAQAGLQTEAPGERGTEGQAVAGVSPEAGEDGARRGRDAGEALIESTRDKLAQAKSRNSAVASKALDALEAKGVDVSEARDALDNYQGVEGSDYSDAEEYSEARTEAWDGFIETLDGLEAPDVEAQDAELGETGGGQTLALATPGRARRTAAAQIVADVGPAGTETDAESIPRLTPLATKEIEKILAKGLRTVLRTGRLQLKGAAGEFSLKTATGRIKRQHAGSWRVIGHELAHRFSQATNFTGVADEMVLVAQEYYPDPARIPKGFAVAEGMSEYLRIWVVAPERMAKEAPQTTALFERFLRQNVEIGALMDKVRAIAVNDLQGTPLERVGKTILPPGTRFEGRGGIPGVPDPGQAKEGEYAVTGWWNRLIFQTADYTIPFRDVYEVAAEKGYRGLDLGKLAAVSGQAREQARNDYLRGGRDKAGRPVLPGKRALAAITEEASKTPGGVTLLDNIIHALRYNERYQRGFVDAPISRVEAKAAVAQAERDHPGMVKLAKEYTETLSETVLEKMVRAEALSPEAAERVRKGSAFYIPLYHVGSKGGGTTEGNRAAGSPVKAYRGSTEEVVDFLTATMAKLTEVEHAIEFSRMLNSLTDAIDQPGMGIFGEIIPRPLVAQRIGIKQLDSQAEKLLSDAADITDEDRAVRMFFPGGLQNINAQEPIIMARKGDAVRFVRLAPDVYRAVQAMAPVETDLVVKIAAGISQFFRMGNLATPVYLWNAPMRDIFQSSIQTETPERSIVLGMLSGAAKAAGLDPKLMDLYIQSGAYGSAAQEAINAMLNARADSGLLPTGAPGWRRTARGALVRIVNSPSDVLRVFEESPRVAEFEAVLKRRLAKQNITVEDVKEGKVPAELTRKVETALLDAAYASREIVANFSLHGAYRPLRKYMRAVTFFQGASQGLYRAGRQFRYKPGLTLGRIGYTLLPIALLSWYLNKDNEDYADKISEERDRYFLFPIGDRKNPLFWVGLAKPYEYALPINLTERFLDWSLTQHPNRRKPHTDLGSAFGQALSLNFIPQMLSLYVNLRANENSFGSPIVPQGKTDLFKELQHGPGTSKIAIQATRLLSSVMGKAGALVGKPEWSEKTMGPLAIDYAAREVAGVRWDILTGVTNRLLPDSMPGAEPRAGLEYAPVVGGIIRGRTEGGSRIKEKFYADLNRAESLARAAGEWATKGKPASTITARDVELVRNLPALRALRRDLSEIRKQVQELEADKTISPQGKHKYRLRLAWYEKAAAGLVYGFDPPALLPGTEWTEAHVNDAMEHLTAVANKAMANERKTKGGPSEQAKLLEQHVKKR